MNSVNNRPPMPNTVGYDMSPNARLRRADESLRVPDSPLAKASSAAKNAVPAHLEHLSGQNKQLAEKYDQMVAKLTPQIMKLQEQVNQLAQHPKVKAASGKEAAPSNPSTRGDPAAKQNGTSPEARGRMDNTQGAGRDAPPSLERLTAENKQLGDRLNQLESGFNSVVKGLQDQIGDLSKRLGADTPQTRMPPAAQGQGQANQGASSGQGKQGAAQGQGQGQANQGASSGQGKQGAAQGQGQANQGASSGQGKQGAAQSNESNPPDRSDESNQAPRTLEDLARDNEQLRTRIDQMMAEFSKVISELQKQIEQLNNQIKALKG